MSGSGLLRVPVPGGEEEEEEEEEEEDAFKVHLIPRSSPTPRRRDRSPEEVEEPSLSRKVHFADSCGLDLVHLQYYCQFEPSEPREAEGGESRLGFRLRPAFALPASPGQLLGRVEERGLELESVEPLEDPLSVRGLVRVLNVDFQKVVQVRATLDGWATFYDYPAEHMETAADGRTDLFAFSLTFPQACAQDGATMAFVLRYETPGGVRWANNGGDNYSLVCEADKSQEEEEEVGAPAAGREDRELRSCLKTTSLRYGERDEGPEELDTGNRDWTNDTETADPTPPGNSALQIPRVQVSQLLTQPLPDKTTESPPPWDTFTPIEVGQEPGEGQETPAQQRHPPGTSGLPEGCGAEVPGERREGGGLPEAEGESRAEVPPPSPGGECPGAGTSWAGSEPEAGPSCAGSGAPEAGEGPSPWCQEPPPPAHLQDPGGGEPPTPGSWEQGCAEGEVGSGRQEAGAGDNEGEGGALGAQLDLESLAALKDVAALTTRSLQVLVFLRVAAEGPGSLLWCTLYLLSTFLP